MQRNWVNAEVSAERTKKIYAEKNAYMNSTVAHKSVTIQSLK